MKQVSFTQMKNGTPDEYNFLQNLEVQFANNTHERILNYMAQDQETLLGYQITRLEHSLQTATRAYQDKAETEMVVAALIHDIGDNLCPYNHAEFATAILRPYVSEKCAWVIEKHALFQKYYYSHHNGGNRNQRDKYKTHVFYQDCVDFCENWDQASFAPDYKSHNLEFFAPMVKEIFNRKPRFQE